MKLKKRATRLIALLICLTMILCGCGESFLTAQVPFYDMVYSRPSYEELENKTKEILDAFAGDGGSYVKVTSLMNEFFTSLSTYMTMESLANIYYSANTQSEKYREECSFFTEHSMLVQKCREQILIASAKSKHAKQLSKQFFGMDLSEYENYARYTNPEYLSLALREAELVEEYRNAVSDAEIDGQNVWEALDSASDASKYNDLLTRFFEAYTETFAGYYHDLTTVRKEMARLAGYDTYLDLAGEGLGREIKAGEMKAYLEQVKHALSEVDFDIDTSLSGKLNRVSDENEAYAILRALCASFDEQDGGSFFLDYYGYMRRNQLCDLSYSSRKEGVSFTTYLYDYYQPYILISPSGSLADVMTLVHEFGHFVDMDYTYYSVSSIDLAEVYSTGLEMLAPHYLDGVTELLSEEERRAILEYQKDSVLQTFRSQGILAEFEMAVFDPESEVDTSDPDEMCALYRSICNEWGRNVTEDNLVSSRNWTVVPHIFQYPSYVFSYCISMDAAIQLVNLEANSTGEGLASYMKLLNRRTGANVDMITVLTEAGLQSPLSEGHVKALLSSYLAPASQKETQAAA